jgi:hypothetical protein
MDELRIAAGSSYARSAIRPAELLAKQEELDYMSFECLAERTIALAQLEKLKDPSKGYNPLLEERIRRVLPDCLENDITVVTNMGAVNPERAAERTVEVSRELGLDDVTVASVTGSDVSDKFDDFQQTLLNGEKLQDYTEDAVSAQAYMGIGGIVEALENDADVVITGRVSDVSLFLGPMVHEFGWSIDPLDEPDSVGQGIAASHLLECSNNVTGGYFADPGYKDVENLADLAYPIAEISADGDVVITKPEGTGGEVTPRTCKEQLFYEVGDPSEYITPDAVADFSQITLDQVGEDRVRVQNATAEPRTQTLKVNIGYDDGIVGEGQISYAGPGAYNRAKLAGEVVKERIDQRDIEYRDIRVDFIGVDALHGEIGRRQTEDPYEVRLRVAAKCPTQRDADRVTRLVENLYGSGPAGGGGGMRDSKRVIGIVSTLIDRDDVPATVTYEEVSA